MVFYVPHPLKSTWQGIKQRCNNPNNRLYDVYGGRGIKVCERWTNSFDDFVADVVVKPEGKSLDRKDPNGNYSPSNCRWATPKEQARNTRRTRYVTIEGVEYKAADLAERFNIKTDTIVSRAEYGMTLAEIESGKRVPIYDVMKHIKKANQANIDRMAKRTHCHKGHKYTKESVRVTKEGWRECKICRREKAQRYRDAKKNKK